MNDAAEPLITVRGEATAEVEPELAQLSVMVTARDRDRDRVVRDLDERARAVDAVLGAHQAEIERVETEAVRLSPQFATNKPRERVAGYEGTVRRTVLLHDFTGLGDLLVQLASIELASVVGPWWSLRPDSAAYREVRVAAVHDAVRRAREYAEALGATLVGLVELADAALLSEAASSMPASLSATAQAFRGAAAPETFSFDVTPTRQLLQATVEARFRASPPVLT